MVSENTEKSKAVGQGQPQTRDAGRERLSSDGYPAVDLVSLGCYAGGVKMSFEGVGRKVDSLPFDWVYVRLDGILHFLRTDFSGFFDFAAMFAVPNTSMMLYRSYFHSFCHDDPTDPATRLRYSDMIERFGRLGQRGQRTLFVRVVASSAEIAQAEELHSELSARFGGETAHLLVVVDAQKRLAGPVIISGRSGLLVYFNDEEQSLPKRVTGASYREAVRCGLKWATGRPCCATVLPSIDDLLSHVDDTVGPAGLGRAVSYACVRG